MNLISDLRRCFRWREIKETVIGNDRSKHKVIEICSFYVTLMLQCYIYYVEDG